MVFYMAVAFSRGGREVHLAVGTDREDVAARGQRAFRAMGYRAGYVLHIVRFGHAGSEGGNVAKVDGDRALKRGR